MKKLNIFFSNSISTHKWGGGEKWMVTAARGLKARGHNVIISGKANSEFTTILDDQKIRSHKKLFGTATPKLYKPYIKKAAQTAFSEPTKNTADVDLTLSGVESDSEVIRKILEAEDETGLDIF